MKHQVMQPERHPATINKCQLVRQSCNKVIEQSTHVKINMQPIFSLIQKFRYTPFNQFQHHRTPEDPQKTLLYLFVLDSLNFCFWPLQGFEYNQLAECVQKGVVKGSVGLQMLAKISEDHVKDHIFAGVDVPLISQRARILREMANVVIKDFDGSFINIIKSAHKSAVKLLQILTRHFPNFQDHSIYKGQQIHFLKRPQILIGDIWGKFQGTSCGQFHDISELTMFPDYRVPQILNEYQILQYSNQLTEIINNKQQIQSGSLFEIEIRAASVVAVEKVKKQLAERGKVVNSVEIDWFLWELGETSLGKIVNHHRTLTIYY